jgi:hypothetical protein
MLNQHSHIAQPRQIRLTLTNGDRVQITAAQAKLLTLFDDGILTGETQSLHLNTLVKRGWAIRSRGSYQLTPAGRDAHTALTAYYERKKTALAQEQDRP